MRMNAQFDSWNEIRTAFFVARYGTLSAAAEKLDIHHTTAQRQITALENKLGTRLFYRNARGYAPTDAGVALLKVAEETQGQFDQLAARIAGLDRQLSGKLVITTVPEFATALVPLIAEYQRDNPDLSIELIADRRLLKLEYGEAHVSLRAGRPPSEPDNIAQKLVDAAATLFASRDYVARYGRMGSLKDTEGHRFVSNLSTNSTSPLAAWMSESIPESAIAFRGGEIEAITAAVENGMGVGPLLCWPAHANEKLLPMIPPPPDWFGTMWLVTHIDLHRTAKVQSFLGFMKDAVAERLPDITGDSIRSRFSGHGSPK